MNESATAPAAVTDYAPPLDRFLALGKPDLDVTDHDVKKGCEANG